MRRLSPTLAPPVLPPTEEEARGEGCGGGGPHLIPGLWVGPARQQQPHALLVAFEGRAKQGRLVVLERRGAHDAGE